MDAYTFMVQQRTFEVHGHALNPSTSGSSAVVGSTDGSYLPVDAVRPTKASKREQKRKRAGKGDAGVVDGDEAYMGPWAAYANENVAEVVEEDPEAEEEWRQEKKRRDEAKEAAVEKMKEARVEKSIFHGTSLLVQAGVCQSKPMPMLTLSSGKELTDYAGRTYMHIPTDTDVKLNPADGSTPPNSYLPEKCIHTWVRLTSVQSSQARADVS